ncbi:hypothetical protein ACFQ6N_05880 [Kitasatospora sp. NPDC056446]|uniref:hypothetical protein n=1 Tax=Kitasatospora sp. NPDC056446 TaxID=3345819 RepID=UPI0036D0EA25
MSERGELGTRGRAQTDTPAGTAVDEPSDDSSGTFGISGTFGAIGEIGEIGEARA